MISSDRIRQVSYYSGSIIEENCSEGYYMSQKKVYFYEVELFDTKSEVEKDYHLLKEILISIIKKDAKKQNGYSTLDLTLDDDPLHVVLDVFEYENSRLFCRLSRQKPACVYLQRDYRTFQKSDVLGGENETIKGIEKYTYGYLNYQTGVFSIVKAVEAPSEKALANILVKYCRDYYMKLTPIPNADGINSIYRGEDAQISRVSVEVPVPDAGTLQQIFGWEDKEILEVVSQRAATAVFELKAPARYVITNNSEDSTRIIDCIYGAMDGYKKAKMRAKAKNIKAQEYNFFEEYFSYSVDISTYHIEDYRRVYFTVDELVDIYRSNLIAAYNENRVIIETITGRK